MSIYLRPGERIRLGAVVLTVLDVEESCILFGIDGDDPLPDSGGEPAWDKEPARLPLPNTA